MQTRKRPLVILAIFVVVSLVSSWYFVYVPRMPGDQPNPKLVGIFNEAIDATIGKIRTPVLPPGFGDEYIPAAPTNAKQFLTGVREVVKRCKTANRGVNSHVLDITLTTGELYEDVPSLGSTSSCMPRHDTPMRITFADGHVVHVTTDGSEQDNPVAQAEKDAEYVIDGLLRWHSRRRPDLYFKPTPKPPTPAEEWSARP